MIGPAGFEKAVPKRRFDGRFGSGCYLGLQDDGKRTEAAWKRWAWSLAASAGSVAAYIAIIIGMTVVAVVSVLMLKTLHVASW